MGSKVSQTPSLADAMTRAQASAGRELRVDTVLRNLGDERGVLDAWLRDIDVKGHMIEKALADHARSTGGDVTASPAAVAKWRKANGIS